MQPTFYPWPLKQEQNIICYLDTRSLPLATSAVEEHTTKATRLFSHLFHLYIQAFVIAEGMKI